MKITFEALYLPHIETLYDLQSSFEKQHYVFNPLLARQDFSGYWHEQLRDEGLDASILEYRIDCKYTEREEKVDQLITSRIGNEDYQYEIEDLVHALAFVNSMQHLEIFDLNSDGKVDTLDEQLYRFAAQGIEHINY